MWNCRTCENPRLIKPAELNSINVLNCRTAEPLEHLITGLKNLENFLKNEKI